MFYLCGMFDGCFILKSLMKLREIKKNNMKNIERKDLQIISRHSNLSKKGIKKVLSEVVYNDAESWLKFLRLLFISLGVSFTTAGIIFFFAYNWNDLDKFIKMGLIEVLIVLTTSTVLFSQFKLDIKNILLTGASVLVGVLFAVFGQIYQTGANAYDFFLGWTLCISLWVFVANFPPLWLVYFTLVNTTFVCYSEQISNWSNHSMFFMQFILNAFFLLFFIVLKEKVKGLIAPTWFLNVLALATVCCGTMTCISCFLNNYPDYLGVILFCIFVFYIAGIFYGLAIKSNFYIAIISFSSIVIISALLIRIAFDFDHLDLLIPIFLVLSAFIFISVAAIVYTLIHLQKKWNNGN